MRATPPPRLWGHLLGLLLCFHVVSAGVVRPLPRQGGVSDATATTFSSTTEDAATISPAVSSGSTAFPGGETSSIPSSASATETSIAPVPTVTGGTSGINSTLFNVTIAAGDLPLVPRITPGFSVAGVVLMLTGTAYSLVGIKTRWLHCFLSAAFLAAAGVTVLILYVMNPPITDAVQGAYVLAAAGTGLLLGGAALVFKEVTECLACLLGGFCLAMWLLTLKQGGLLGSGGAGVIIFIAVLSAAGFAGYFSRWTRAQFMIACISLSGATAVVMGIDCFSRAGLKEYWAWIWALNDNLFPLGADTYPLTRGIRVEQAVTIIVALIGIVSQNKLWLIVKERRARKEEERVRVEAENQVQEANVGRDVERVNADERNQWEAVYGDPKSPMRAHLSEDSVVGDIYHEKKRRNSGTTTTATATRRSTIDEREEIEMAEIPIDEEAGVGNAAVTGLEGDKSAAPPKPKTAAEKVLDRNADGMVTVRVAVDDVDAGSPAEAVEAEKVWHIGDDGEARLIPKASAEHLRALSSTPAPNLVSLPFRVPDAEPVVGGHDDQSSVAAIADDDGDLLETRSNVSRRSSFAKRLSVGSADFFRRISQRSLGRQIGTTPRGDGDSREDLTSPIKDDNESVAATLDQSDVCSDRAETPTAERPFSMEVKAELVGEATQNYIPAKRATSEATISTSILSSPPVVASTARITDATEFKTEQDSLVTSENTTEKQVEVSPMEGDSASKACKSIASEADSGPLTLTKDRLPHGLSKIALSYRTNEWAKHLSNAEMPSPAEIWIPHEPGPEPIEVKAAGEKAAPVNVAELKKTALDATPPPAMPRTASAMSVQRPTNLAVPGSNVSVKAPPYSPSSSETSHPSQSHLSPNQRISLDSRRASGRTVTAVTEDNDTRSLISTESRRAAIKAAEASLAGEVAGVASPIPSNGIGAPPATSPVSPRPPVRGLVSYDSPQTLIGKRDLLMRKKNSVLRPDSVQAGIISPAPSAAVSESGSVRGGSAAYGTVAALPPPAMSHPNAAGSTPNSRKSSGIVGISGSPPVDIDDLPLSQRKAMMRQESMLSINSGSKQRSSSLGYGAVGGSTHSLVAGAGFNSHQPQRTATVPSQTGRDAQLTNFRPSVQHGLRATPTGLPAASANAQLGYGGGFNGAQHAGPLINSIYGVPGTSSANSLPQHVVQQSHDAEVQRDIEVQRSFLMGQKHAEAQKRQALKAERERAGKRFEERIRTDRDMMEMHREAIRKMQRRASQADQRQQQ